MSQTSMQFAAGLLAAASACVFSPRAHAQNPVPDSPAIEQRVSAMLAKMSLERKIDLIGGQDSMFIRAVPEIGFPRLKMSDGPLGVRTWGPSTAYAAGIALAASWDPALAERIGAAIGQDARARGVNFLLGPAVNIYRAPMNGRNFEYFGEDPYLAARLAVGYINGVQSQGVSATIKHFAANNSEFDRHNINSVVDERTLHEIYLPAFEAGVREAHVGAVMDSYNLINGEHLTQSAPLNIDILRKQWGFDGIVMSDWAATYDGVAAANGGLDLEMPSAKFMNRQTLLPAVQQGRVAPAVIDEKVRRILRTAIRFGFLDRDQTDPAIPLYPQTGRQVALDGARESMVLLKNEGGLLPLDPAKLRTIAVIGPDAWPAVPGGGGSSNVTAFAPVGFMTGLSDALAGKVKVVYARGLPTLTEMFQGTDFHRGLKQETFADDSFSGAPATSQTVPHIAQYRAEIRGPRGPRQHGGIRWTGAYLPAKSGRYLFLVAAARQDVYTLTVDGKPLIAETAYEGQAPQAGYLTLRANQPVAIQFDYQPASTPLAGLGIRALEDIVAPEALKLAAMSDAVLVSAGFDASTESEGFDRTFALPWGQDALIQAVAAANPKTIVSITAGGGVAMTDWIGKVPALIHNWYPGQEGGVAMAEILLGERSPEGKLPAGFEKTWSDNPVHDTYYPPSTGGGEVPTVKYAEGVFLGYRYYTTMGKEPLFPFGFGLSYTTFSFGNLKLSSTETTADAGVTASFDVTNTGARAGAEVAQLYVGDPSARVKRPVKELKGFKKLRLEPGETGRVTLHLDRRALAYWSEQRHDWQVDPGRFVVFVGDSSENTPLSSDFRVQP